MRAYNAFHKSDPTATKGAQTVQKFCTVWSCPDIFGGKRIKLSKAGYFAHSLHAYGRDGLPCDRCGTLIRREAFMNRSSHYCPKCQRLR